MQFYLSVPNMWHTAVLSVCTQYVTHCSAVCLYPICDTLQCCLSVPNMWHTAVVGNKISIYKTKISNLKVTYNIHYNIYIYIYIDNKRDRLSGKQRFEPFMFCVKIVCESRQSNVGVWQTNIWVRSTGEEILIDKERPRPSQKKNIYPIALFAWDWTRASAARLDCWPPEETDGICEYRRRTGAIF
jgi:hypothetical protein